MTATLLYALAAAIAITSLAPLLLLLRNWKMYVPPPHAPNNSDRPLPRVSLLIPARNEADKIEATLRHALANIGVQLELLVLDDDSTDNTAAIVRRVADEDPRVGLIQAPPLPAGWNGKQRACHLLAQSASHPVLVFLDADVRLERDALARGVAFLQQSGASLVSGIPHQDTETLLEKLILPLIHVLLLGYLPIDRMRRSRLPAYGAGCGQLFIADRDAYARCGGHTSIAMSRHDGIMLPRAFRRAGFATDLFDAEAIASCRMYRSAGEVWRGLRKNSTEGIGSPTGIVPWTLILLLGHVLPWVILLMYVSHFVPFSHIGMLLVICSATAVCAGYVIRIICLLRFRQSRLGSALHPIGVVLLVLIQWDGLLRHLLGRPTYWKGRGQVAAAPLG